MNRPLRNGQRLLHFLRKTIDWVNANGELILPTTEDGRLKIDD
jgi:hypothetical protein